METLRTLWPGHVLRILVEEHDVILDALDRLEGIDRQLLQAPPTGTVQSAEALRNIAALLLEAESHHQREEQVLFPTLEEFGFDGPSAVMREEHVELRFKKHALRDLAERAEDMPAKEFVPLFHPLACDLIGALRDHIERENTILFPESLDIIQDKETWDVMKKQCDNLGYCNFTPQIDFSV